MVQLLSASLVGYDDHNLDEVLGGRNNFWYTLYVYIEVYSQLRWNLPLSEDLL